MEPSAKLVQSTDLIFRVINDDGIIYNPSTKRLHMLNRTALLAWEMWDGEHSLTDIVDVIVAEYEADREAVMRDVAGCADELRRHGLLSEAA